MDQFGRWLKSVVEVDDWPIMRIAKLMPKESIAGLVVIYTVSQNIPLDERFNWIVFPVSFVIVPALIGIQFVRVLHAPTSQVVAIVISIIAIALELEKDRVATLLNAQSPDQVTMFVFALGAIWGLALRAVLKIGK